MPDERRDDAPAQHHDARNNADDADLDPPNVTRLLRVRAVQKTPGKRRQDNSKNARLGHALNKRYRKQAKQKFFARRRHEPDGYTRDPQTNLQQAAIGFVCIVARAFELPLIQLHQEQKRSNTCAQLDGPAPACLSLLRERDAHPQRAPKKQNVRNDGDLVVQNIRRAKLLIAAFPRFRNLQELFAPSDFVSLQRDLQPVGRVFRAEPALLPGKSPIQAIGPLARIGFLGKKVPAAQIESELGVEIILSAGLCRSAIERRSRARFLDFVIVPGDLSGGAHAHPEFLFLLRLEETHLPEPDIQLRGHQLVCLLQTEFALQIDLGVVVYVENDRGFVAADVLTEAADEFLRSCERFLAGDLA